MRRATAWSSTTVRLSNLTAQWRSSYIRVGIPGVSFGLDAFCRHQCRNYAAKARTPKPRQKAPPQHILVSKYNKALKKLVRARQFELQQKGIAIARVPRPDLEDSKREGSEEQREEWLRLLSSITDPTDRTVSKKIFQILVVALRRLRATELEEIIKLSIKDLPSEIAKDLFEPNIRRGLIEIDEGGYVVFKSKYFKQMLIARRMQNTEPETSEFFIDGEVAHTEVARALLMYMGGYGESGPCDTIREWKEREAAYPLMRYAASSWHAHCFEAHTYRSTLTELASKFWTTGVKSYFGAWLQAHYWYVPARGKYFTLYDDMDHALNWKYISWMDAPICRLAFWGLTEFVEAALSHPHTDSDVAMAMHTAIRAEKDEVVSLLLKHGADFKASEISANGANYLHTAVENGSVSTLWILLSHPGAVDAINAFNSKGQTPLHLATSKYKKEMMKVLLEKGADIDVPGEKGWTALHQAVRRLEPEIAYALLGAGANPHGSSYLNTPLHVAHATRTMDEVQSGIAKRLVRMLMLRGANPVARDADGFTPLHAAVMKNDLRVVEALLPQYSSEDINAVGMLGTQEDSTALTSSFIYGSSERIVQYLLARGAKGPSTEPGHLLSQLVEHANQHNGLIFHLFYNSFPEEISHYEAATGKSVLEMMIRTPQVPSPIAIKFLQSQRPDWPDTIFRDYEPYADSAMEAAARFLVLDIVSYAASHPSEGEKFPWKDIWETAVDPPSLHRKYQEGINSLLKFRPEFRTAEYLLPALFKSFWEEAINEQPQLFYLRYIESLPGEPLLEYADPDTGETLLHRACEAASDIVVSHLLNVHNANVNVQDKFGRTPLMRCFESNPVKNWEKGVIQRLLEHGANPIITDNDNRTAITHLLMSSHWDSRYLEVPALLLLLQHPGAKEVLNISDSSGLKPIDHACRRHRYAATRELIDAGAEIRLKDDNGVELLAQMTLDASPSRYRSPLADELLSMGADIYALNEEGKCFVHEAFGFLGDCRLTGLVTDRDGFDPMAPLPRREGDDQTPLELPFHWSIKNSPTKAFFILQRAKPVWKEKMVHGKSADGKESTALHLSTKIGSVALVRALIDAGADLNAVDALGRTPLFFINRRESGLSLTGGAAVESVTCGYWLLKAGADPNFRNPVTGKTVYQSIKEYEGFDLKKPALQLLKDFGANDAED